MADKLVMTQEQVEDLLTDATRYMQEQLAVELNRKAKIAMGVCFVAGVWSGMHLYRWLLVLKLAREKMELRPTEK